MANLSVVEIGEIDGFNTKLLDSLSEISDSKVLFSKKGNCVVEIKISTQISDFKNDLCTLDIILRVGSTIYQGLYLRFLGPSFIECNHNCGWIFDTIMIGKPFMTDMCRAGYVAG